MRIRYDRYKKCRPKPAFYHKVSFDLQSYNVCSLWAFLTLFYVKRNLLTFSKSLEAFRSDSAEVYEYISTAVFLSDETETFLFVEPLNDTS